MDNAFRYIKANGGIDTEDSYPYEAKNMRCRFKKENVGATDTGEKLWCTILHNTRHKARYNKSQILLCNPLWNIPTEFKTPGIDNWR